MVQQTFFVTTKLKRKLKNLSPGHVATRLSSRYKNGKTIYVLLATLNAGPHSLFKYGFLLSAYALPFFSCPTVWNQTLF